MSILKRIFPFLTWFENFNLKTIRSDFISGLTVALVLVPQSMAYAQLAGLPAYYGLYAAFLPPMIASLFGSSRQLATGPVAVVSLMTAATLEPLATAGSEQYIAYALLLALIAGLFQFTLGVLKLGAIVNFLSHPVVNGFTNAAAIIIATSQLSKLFGVYVDKAPHHYETIIRVIQAAFHYTHWPTLAMAAISFATMIVLKRVDKRIPNVLIAVAITTFISWIVGFQENETIQVDQIHSSRAIELIGKFNEAVTSKETLEVKRGEIKEVWNEFEASSSNLCTRCHDSREMRLGELELEANEKDITRSDNALVLHNMSGLVDRHIAELKQMLSVHRAELREMLFEKVESPNGSSQFYLEGDTPDNSATQDGTWRLKVGNKHLDPNALGVSGGGAVVAEIPLGLPSISMPEFDLDIVLELLTAAIIISLLGFMEAISIAKAMAARTRQKLDPNQELVGQGLANIIGCLGQSYAVSGSFSRSAVNLQSGARTGLSNVFSSGIVMIVLLFLASLLYHLPQAVLASIIMMAVFGLLNLRGFVHAWRTSRFDGTVSMVTFLGTLLLAPHLEWGIFMGVILSLGGYLYRTMRPRVVDLVPQRDGAMLDAKRHGLKSCQHIAVVSFEGPLNFASTNYLENEILNRVSEFPKLKHLLIAGNGISEIDATGEETLRHIVDNLKDAGCEVSFSGISDKVVDVLKRSLLYDHIGKEHFHGTQAQAIATIYPSTHFQTDEEECPYHLIMPPIIELSLHPDGSLRNAERHELRNCRHIATLRFDGQLTFANAAYMEQEILASLADRHGLRHVVFSSHSINRIDDLVAQKLADLVERLKGDGYSVSFCGLKEEVVDVLERTHVIEIIGKENIHPTETRAITNLYASAHMGSSESDCPLSGLANSFTELSLHKDGSLREAEQNSLRLCRHIGLLRFDGPMPLSNLKASQSEFIRWAKVRSEVQNVILLANTLDKLSDIEAENLLALVEAIRAAGYRVCLAEFSDRAFETLSESNVVEEIGMDSFYQTSALAIAGIFTDAHADDMEEDCPIRGILPRLVELSKQEDGSLGDAQKFDLALCQHIVAVRLDGALNFATIKYFEQSLRSVLKRRQSAKHILFAAHTLSELDSTAAKQLPVLFRELRQEGYWIAVSGLKDDVSRLLQQINPDDHIGSNGIFQTRAKAIEHIHKDAHRNSKEKTCPLIEIVHARK